MNKIKTVKIPDLMKSLPVTSQGFPVPYVVLVDDNGTHFKINDRLKQIKCFTEKLCHICGNKVKRNEFWFVGGQQSAFHPHGVYNDGGMHYECASYALQVCPYLAMSSYAGYTDAGLLKAVQKVKNNKGMLFMNTTQTLDRLPFFVLVNAKTFAMTGEGYIKPERPYIKHEFWKDGRQITRQQADTLLEGQVSYLPKLKT